MKPTEELAAMARLLKERDRLKLELEGALQLAKIWRQQRDEARKVARELLDGLPETARIWQYDWHGDYPWLLEQKETAPP